MLGALTARIGGPQLTQPLLPRPAMWYASRRRSLTISTSSRPRFWGAIGYAALRNARQMARGGASSCFGMISCWRCPTSPLQPIASQPWFVSGIRACDLRSQPSTARPTLRSKMRSLPSSLARSRLLGSLGSPPGISTRFIGQGIKTSGMLTPVESTGSVQLSIVVSLKKSTSRIGGSPGATRGQTQP